MEISSTNHLPYTNRWFAYFDLLGFSNLVRNHKIEHVLPIYENVLNAIALKADPKRKQGISYSWFSDTFIIFSKGSSEKEFALIEHVSRLFFQKLILNEIPVRGSLTIGQLYTQKKKNIFLGEALIDAYEYGENQNWLGFILTPNVYRHFHNGTLQLEHRAHYRAVDINGIIRHHNADNVYAFAFNNSRVNGKNPYMKAISAMKEKAGIKYKDKYENTEKFISLYEKSDRFPTS